MRVILNKMAPRRDYVSGAAGSVIDKRGKETPGPRLREYLNLLTPTDEFIIVVVAAFGVPLVANVYVVFFARYSAPVITEAGLHSLLIVEPVILLGVAAFLHARDWSLETIGLMPSLKETLLGVGLAFVIAFVTLAFWHTVTLVGLSRPATPQVVVGPFSPITVIAVSIINPIYEETLLSGYVVTALQRRTSWQIAVAGSVALRVLCHIYQGFGAIFIVIFGFVLVGWYARYGRLWPLIVAHVFYDFFPLMAHQG